MARYLLVAHQTATSPHLIQRLREIAELDRAAEFTILVPETHVQRRLVCDEEETRIAARRRAGEARLALTQAGLRLAHTEIGCASPSAAVNDELRRRPVEYDAIVLSTFAPGKSRWLTSDLPSRLERTHRLPVFHVYPDGDAAWAASEERRRSVARGDREQQRESAVVAEVAAFRSKRDVLPIAALLAVHAGIGAFLAIQYSRTFLVGEVSILAFFSFLVFALWQSDVARSGQRGPSDGPGWLGRWRGMVGR